jgi:aminoglycoside 2''-phosphotransferase
LFAENAPVTPSLDSYLATIRAVTPALEISTAQLNTDGMTNAVVVVNDELVFRFPKTEAAHALQRYEAALLAAIQPQVPVALPQVEEQNGQFARYRLVPGEPLYRHRLLQAPAPDQERVLAQLGAFLVALHAVPLEGLPPPPWRRPAATVAAHARALGRLDQVRQQLYPHLWRDQRAWVEHLYEPVLNGSVDLDAFTPRLIHADLASYHILIHPERWALSGVIDFGTAGPGDPAVDIALLLNTYGESVVRRIGVTYPIEPALLDRARFLAGALELEWALAGLADSDPSMFLVHLGRARDIMPIGSRWG